MSGVTPLLLRGEVIRKDTKQHPRLFQLLLPLQKNIYLQTGVVKVLQEIGITNTLNWLEMNLLEEENLLQEN